LSRIQVLSTDVREKIAAGEVVESAFSVVKELIENSIDAVANQINVQVLESGFKKIMVQDDGEGIFRDDLQLAIQDHATSKIKDVHDIEKIYSYGFRGEALASISAISDLTILSRKKEESLGGKLTKKAGDLKIEDYAGSPGTTIIVDNLFYNIPARKKFLKSPRVELRYLREIFLKMALVNPGVDFTLDVEGKRQFTLPKAVDLAERVRQIYGPEMVNNLYFAELQDLKVKIKGFFSKPNYLKSSRNWQFFYINGRPVDYKYLGFLLSKGYEAVAFKGQYPVGLIFMEIPSELIDVNIHPAKREVKLFDQKYIDNLILSLVKKVLNQEHNLESRNFSPVENFNGKLKPETIKGDNFKQNQLFKAPLTPSLNKNKADFFQKTSQPFPSSALSPAEDDFKIIGVIFYTYIVIEKDDSLHYLDFHAAHERMIYDQLLKKNKEIEKQELIFPEVLELPLEDYRLILEYKDNLADFGFMVEDFSDQSVKVTTVPVIGRKIKAEEIIKNFLEAVKEERDNNFDFREKIVSSIACQAAKRAGDYLSSSEMEQMVKKIFKGQHEMRCPHGRPYLYKIKKDELARLFKR